MKRLYINNQSITIKFGDIFKEKGLKVIPCNEYFDDVVDEKIISAKTLHGMFLNNYFSNRKLYELMDAQWILKNSKKEKVNDRFQFELGSTLFYQDFCLVAFSRFDKNNKAYLSDEDYSECMDYMWNNIFKHLDLEEKEKQNPKMSFNSIKTMISKLGNVKENEQVINLPVMGSGVTELPKMFTRYANKVHWLFGKIISQMLEPLKDEFTGASINIIIHDSLKDVVDLNVIGNMVKYFLKYKYDFYIASGFFNDKQIEQVETIKKLLEKYNYTYFSPKDESQVPDISTMIARQQVFHDNVSAIRLSKGMIVNTDNKDMGTLWEAGYGCGGFDLRVIYLHLSKKDPFNLMLSESAYASCSSFEELEEVLKTGERKYWGKPVE